MSHSARFVKGQWLADCDRCGRTLLAKDLRKEWDNLMVCSWCWETRQPQDFVRAKTDIQAPPWTRPEGSDQYAYAVCNTNTSYAGLATAGCAIAGSTQLPTAEVYPVPSSTFTV